MAGFDVAGARKAGYSDDEIIQHLTQSRKFDIAGALNSGYSKQEIIDHLSGKPSQSQTVSGMEQLGGTPPGPPKPPNPITFQRSPLGQGNAIAYEAKTGMPPREEEFTRGMNEIPPVMYLPPSIAAATTGPGAFAVSTGVGYGTSKGARALGASPVVSDVLGALASMGTGMGYARMLPGIFPRTLSEPTTNFLNMLPGKNYGDAANKFLESVHPPVSVSPRFGHAPMGSSGDPLPPPPAPRPVPQPLFGHAPVGTTGDPLPPLPPPPASSPVPTSTTGYAPFGSTGERVPTATSNAAPLKLTPPPTQGSLTAGFSARTLQQMKELGITESELSDPKIAQQVKQLDIANRKALQKPPK